MFNPPQIYDAVQRTRLFNLLDEKSPGQNILIVGQAAQGKSTLIASYLKASASPTLWFQLSPADNSPSKLYDRLSRGISSLSPETFESGEPGSFRAMLGTAGDAPRFLEMLPTLFKELKKSTTIVMDDLHTLDETGMGFVLIKALLDLQINNFKLILITRTLPTMDIPRLKMGRRLFVVENDTLAFTLDETRQYFSQININPDVDLEKIHQATEGWAGGLTLVSESIRQFNNVPRLPEKFSAEVFSYFSQEIYSHLDTHIQDFLLKSSILCDIDLEAVEHVLEVIDGPTILSSLERRNLFIQRLNPGIGSPCYKFHDLFREFLQQKLISAEGEDAVRKLNRKAGRFYWDRKDHEQAADYFIRAGSFPDIVKIITVKGTDYVIKGKLTEPERWLNHLPENLISETPWLLFFQSMTQRIKAGRKNISRLERALSLFEKDNDIRGMLLSTAYLIEAAVFIRLPSPKIIWWINRGESMLREIGSSHRFPWARALLWQMIGLGYIAGDGNIPKGISACRNAILLARQIQNPELIFNASITMTLGYVQAGDFSHANDLLTRIEDMTHPEQHPEYRCLKYIVDIELELKNGRFDSARDLLRRSEADIEKFGLIFLYPGYIEAKAYHLIYTSRFSEARQMADHLNDFSILEGNDFYSGISHRIKALSELYEQRYDSALKHAGLAVVHLNKTKKGDIHHFLARQMEGIILYRHKKMKPAITSLSDSLAYFTAISSDLSIVETQIALGLAKWELGKKKDGLDCLKSGLEKACINQYEFFPLLDKDMLASAILILAANLGPNTMDRHSGRLIAACRGQAVLSRISQLLSQTKNSEKIRIKENLRPIYKKLLPKLRISTLGRFEVQCDADRFDPTSLERSRPVLLLKSIVLHGARDIPKEILIDDLWPDADAASGEKNFKINLHRLRKAIEPEYEKAFGYSYIIQKAGLVSLDPELVDLDINEFLLSAKTALRHHTEGRTDDALRHYETALQIYKGDYFAEEPYMEWIHRKRELYRSKYMELLQKKAALHEEIKQPEQAIETWRALLQADPCHETAYQNLMILYAASGQKSMAIDLFRDCRNMLENELGARPESRTIQIYEKIRSL